ncbi:hypothetical protein STEG23_006534, partial [Scotinomys teguina]
CKPNSNDKDSDTSYDYCHMAVKAVGPGEGKGPCDLSPASPVLALQDRVAAVCCRLCAPQGVESALTQLIWSVEVLVTSASCCQMSHIPAKTFQLWNIFVTSWTLNCLLPVILSCVILNPQTSKTLKFLLVFEPSGEGHWEGDLRTVLKRLTATRSPREIGMFYTVWWRLDGLIILIYFHEKGLELGVTLLTSASGRKCLSSLSLRVHASPAHRIRIIELYS